MRFDNKVVLVIGVGCGMGCVIVLVYVCEGVRVVVLVCMLWYGEEIIVQIIVLGGEVYLVGGDIVDCVVVGVMVDGVIEVFGVLDILVYCVVDMVLGLIVEMVDEIFDYLVCSNIQLLFWLVKDVVFYFFKVQDKGWIIFIFFGEVNCKYMLMLIFYSFSKVFMNVFVCGLVVEFGVLNILVNVIELGLIGIDYMFEILGEELFYCLVECFFVLCLGQLVDIVVVVLFFIFSEVFYIIGILLLVDGGVIMVVMFRVEEIFKGY